MEVDEQVKIHEGASVSGEAQLSGDVTIHARTVVHPKATIKAEVHPSPLPTAARTSPVSSPSETRCAPSVRP